MGKLIYLDNAATTKTAPEVVQAMLPYFTEHFGNPSSVYSFASHNKEVISKQRETIANAIGAAENEIYFTAGGSESDNWALKATAEAYQNKGTHIITTKIEHHAILQIRMVGIMLLMSLLTLPQITMNLLTSDFRKIIIGSVLIGFAGSVIGLVLSYYLNIPSGAFIILVFVFVSFSNAMSLKATLLPSFLSSRLT